MATTWVATSARKPGGRYGFMGLRFNVWHLPSGIGGESDDVTPFMSINGLGPLR
jgi:hypothetical protein